MPPKSTYFYPKVPTGLVFNPSSEDLHAQGRRRHHRALVRRPRAEVRRPARGLRLGGRGGVGARRLPRAAAERGGELYEDILRIQRELFVAGAELATAPEAAERLEDGVSAASRTEMVERLEADIDRYMERVDLPPKFVIPGGTELSARLDVARTAVRRAERRVSALNDAGELADDTVLTYLNRLSDALFAMARFADEPEPELFEGRA